ncbi:hypothetical protein GQ44DRAFT_146874 [Phaeosphaeriaceae sp. PMI808]|nr:hypothetical protein GQ44DRAFT_146874 [Phaeosphaeriaceae sp. PMI808]
MYLSSLLSLPPAILLLLCAPTASAESQWPHNIPRHLKYFPEEEVHARRGLDIQQRMKQEKPIGVKKMSTDEGEMFLLDNWIFASDLDKRSDDDEYSYEYEHEHEHRNETCQAQSPLRLLAKDDFFSRFRPRLALSKRQFACPAGTSGCSSIGAPNVCCGAGSTCINVSNSPGVGSVGCCPRGQTCAGSVSCDTRNGFSSCPDAPNGGCCLPGFRCDGIGCAAVGTSITFVQPSSSLPPPSPSPSSTAVVIVPTPSTSALICSTGWFTCSASLGGGCCQNGRTCATGASCIGSPSNTQAPDAPIRPTSGSAASSASPSDNVCPSGFYVCSAYYPTGCCRVGRDCQTTGSCGLPTSTIINTNRVVVVAPTGAGLATTTAPQAGSCPSAWFSCAANRGGNCCPNGYECGEQCTATASGQSGVSQKVAPSAASFTSELSIWIRISVSFGVGAAILIV